jgi:hypothetical protein
MSDLEALLASVADAAAVDAEPAGQLLYGLGLEGTDDAGAVVELFCHFANSNGPRRPDQRRSDVNVKDYPEKVVAYRSRVGQRFGLIFARTITDTVRNAFYKPAKKRGRVARESSVDFCKFNNAIPFDALLIAPVPGNHENHLLIICQRLSLGFSPTGARPLCVVSCTAGA